MILLLIIPVWLLAMLVVAGLCAGARLGDDQLHPLLADAKLTVVGAEGPGEGPAPGRLIDEETRAAALSEQRRTVGIPA